MSMFVDIEKTYGSFHLNVKLESADEVLALLGASGSGKSLTLKCIAGIEKPDRGKIVVDGVTLFDSEKGINLSPQKRRVGLLFQNYALFPNMTVLQNVRVGANREADKNKRAEMVRIVMEQFGLTALSDHYPYQLSGGEQQRAALARILISAPDILLLDEPFSALDSHLRFLLEREVRQVLRRFGKTVVLVSHDRDEVFRMADRVAVIHQGSIEMMGEKERVFLDPQSKNAAILTGCKNISRAELTADGEVYAADWGISLKLPISQDITHIGIRMHHIQPGPGENPVRCRVVEEVENPFSFIVMLEPMAEKCKIPLAWELDKDQWKKIRAEEMELHIPAESILLLKE